MVLTEGLNDVWFLSLLHNEYSDHDRFDYFDNQSEEITENKRISQHVIDTNYEYLYKAEGGRPNLCIIFSDVSQALVGMDIETFILVDLDDEPISELYDEINNNLYTDYGNSTELVERSRQNNHQMYTLDTILQNDSRKDMPVTIFAFHSNLEEAVGINRGEDRQAKMQKIWSYIKQNPSVCENIALELF